jgi:hypothetical protein
MIPERCLHLVRSAGKVSTPIKLDEAVGNVGCGMIETGRFGVGGGESVKGLESVLLSP